MCFHICVRAPKAKRGPQIPWEWSLNSCEPPCRCWELNLDVSVQGKTVPLTTHPFLQPSIPKDLIPLNPILHKLPIQQRLYFIWILLVLFLVLQENSSVKKSRTGGFSGSSINALSPCAEHSDGELLSRQHLPSTAWRMFWELRAYIPTPLWNS